MDYAGGIDLAAFQWNIIANPAPLTWFDSDGDGMAAKEKIPDKYYITVDGNKALEIDMKLIDAAFNQTKNETKFPDSSFKDRTLKLYIPRKESNSYLISSVYIKRGEDKGIIPDVSLDKEKNSSQTVTFNLEHNNEVIFIFYTSQVGDKIITNPVLKIELIRVSPNVAYKQDGSNGIGCIIEKNSTNGVVVTIKSDKKLSGDNVSLCPVFLTLGEELSLSPNNITNALKRTELCLYLVESIALEGFDSEELNADKTLSKDKWGKWIDYTISNTESSCEIKVIDGTIIKASIKKEDAPLVTVRRHKSNNATGYYIEDYYMADTPSSSMCLRGISAENTQRITLEGSQYNVPIVHYRDACDIQLHLVGIDGDEQSEAYYKIGNKQIKLGDVFTVNRNEIQALPGNGILDITDATGVVKGKIEFRKRTESPTLRPILNIVTVNASKVGDSYFQEIINRLNDVYGTINVSWQKGDAIGLALAEINDLQLENVRENKENRDIITDAVKKLSRNQYYMIIVPTLGEAINGFTSGFDQNWFFLKHGHGDNTPAHELGHCNGLDEFAINIGAWDPAIDKERDNPPQGFQYSSSNIMGYLNIYNPIPRSDFYSWQIKKLRDSIQEHLNRK
jgi:hypothetical protein